MPRLSGAPAASRGMPDVTYNLLTIRYFCWDRLLRSFFFVPSSPMKMHLRTRRFAAAFLLLVLLAAYAGQKVHIYLEDHAHFAAHCGDLVPDNGARESVVEYCPVDHYHFFPYLSQSAPAPQFEAEVLAVVPPEATRCRCAWLVTGILLRAPPRG